MRGKFALEYPAGSDVARIYITGDQKNCEPAHVRIVFPGGNFEVVRATDGADADYWVHIYVNRPNDGWFIPGETEVGKIVSARLDVIGKNASEARLGDFNNPNLNHVALRVRRVPA